MMKSKAKTKKH